ATALHRFPRWRYDGAVLNVARPQSCMCRSSVRVATVARLERLSLRFFHIRAGWIITSPEADCDYTLLLALLGAAHRANSVPIPPRRRGMDFFLRGAPDLGGRPGEGPSTTRR